MPVNWLNWDDLARAGDKIPESPDDKKCGDHYISREKDCHDGKAHRPEPGENPYWTDENSAEERRERDIPWDTNKPKSREEREKETDWEPTEKEDDPDSGTLDPADEFEEPEDTDEERGPPDEWKLPPEPLDLRETQHQAAVDKWAQKDAAIQQRRATQQARELSPEITKNYGKKLRKALSEIEVMIMPIYLGNFEYPGSDKPTPGERVEDWLKEQDTAQSWIKFLPQNQSDTDQLADKLREIFGRMDIAAGEELRAGRITNRLSGGGLFQFTSYELEMKQIENLLEQYENDKYATSNPQDILAWERLKKSPEPLRYRSAQNSLKSITEIPGFRFKGIDPNNMSPAEEKYVEHKLKGLELWFSQWKHNPRSGMGGYLAKKLLGGAEQLGPHIDESPLEPNPEAARVIAEMSARAGDETSNDVMWEEFGVSEEWTSESFVHDYKKAARKAIVTAKNELGFDIASFAKENKALDKAERIEKAARKKHLVEYVALRRKKLVLLEQGREGLINDIQYGRENGIINDQLAILDNQDKERSFQTENLRSHLRVKVEAARQALHTGLTQANAETAANPETVAAVLGRLDQPMWRDLSDDKPEQTRQGKVTRKAQKDFDKLMAYRERARQGQPQVQFANAEGIKLTMGRVLGWLHRDLLEGPEGVMLKELNWEAEFSFRARADAASNSVVLDQNQFGAVAAHEFGHHLEFRNRRVEARILDFYNERTEGIEPKRIKSYETWELFKQPRSKAKRFFTDYASKYYEKKGKQGNTELLSLGLEALENEDKFRALLRHDPEHLAIVLATIRGY